jgi:hypothetical protein
LPSGTYLLALPIIYERGKEWLNSAEVYRDGKDEKKRKVSRCAGVQVGR